jgi:U3 small nucleolar RNA-associated protein 21
MLPRTQWENLLHLDAIKERNKPLQPAKKPEAAPFFLPTIPSLSGNPVFAAPGAAGAAAPATTFLRLLRAGGDGDFTSFLAHLRELTPAGIDREMRAMALLEGATDEEERDVRLLLECLDQEVAAGRSFEFVQALLALALAVHGDAVGERPALRAVAGRLLGRLRRSWAAVDELLQSSLCMVGYFGNLQM